MVAPFLKQFYAVSAVWVNMLAQGMLLSYTTSLLPALKEPDSPIRADIHTASWLASSVGVAGIPGFLLSSSLMDLYGRKITHFIVILPGAIGWLMIYFATNIPTLMVGRILGGMSTGATVSLGAVVIGEYSSPKYRGIFLNLKTASVCMGGMLIHILGHFYHWRSVAMMALAPNIFALIIIYTWPESPAWLASKKQYEQSKISFYWLRGQSEESIEELEKMIRTQKLKTMLTRKVRYLESIAEFFKKFTKKDFVKPLIIILVGSLLLEMCGRHLFPAYALQIIGEITGSKSQSFYYTLATDVIITASAVSSSILVKIMKRRTLLFSTGYAAFFVLMIVCTYLFLVSKEIISKDYPWIPIGLFVIYFILANLGCTPIPLALLGEVFPLAHRGTGSAVSGIWMSLCLMLSLQLTPHMLDSIKVYGTFAVFGIVIGITLTILYFMMPETKDKTLQEIEDYFNYGKFENDIDDDPEVKIKMTKNDLDDNVNDRVR
ncbi:hypothetical protein K1T71_013404 [Dendrolimus kikuchii]|uniref:Uncharacterized protein n=1 Tax=Dendrolimus kikuchii TaxID=765133 RepID=A0ACC1CI49_9NEOP|nr:hypothetical protein K1T71_013404 [Dendrolimus kikuchii]